MGWLVTGIEPYSKDAAVARERGIQVLEMGIEEALDEVEAKFDAVVLGDVLEHVADPWTQLSRIRCLCRPDARVVISVPNVAHIFVRAQLMTGRFEYQDRGILDRTHLRFFTRRTAIDLVQEAGLVREATTYSPTPVEILLPSLLVRRWGRWLLAANAKLAMLMPTLFGYQFVMSCRIAGDCQMRSEAT